MADSVSEDEFARRYVELRGLLALGVPWPIAREALASTRLDRDETHAVGERFEALSAWAESDEPTVQPSAVVTRGPGAALPAWWDEDDDGVRIVDRD